jgi:hypothetical protein
MAVEKRIRRFGIAIVMERDMTDVDRRYLYAIPCGERFIVYRP